MTLLLLLFAAPCDLFVRVPRVGTVGGSITFYCKGPLLKDGFE